MIRFAWLQSRTQTFVALGALLVVAVALAITGPRLVHLYDTNIVGCAARGTCGPARDRFLDNYKALRGFGAVLIVIPGLLGVFWGAPLVARELETGTYRLAWTQSTTRTRWLAAKLIVVGLTAMVVTGLMSLMFTWWASPYDTVNSNRFSPTTFDQRGIVIIGYTAFALALGVTAGVIIRRTIPAMATTLIAFVGARIAMIHLIRPHLMAPAHRVTALVPATTGFGVTNSGAAALDPARPDIPNAWMLSTRVVDHAGRGITSAYLRHACPSLGVRKPLDVPSGGSVRAEVPPEAQNLLQSCVAKVATKYQVVTTYQPADRYWTFQAYEVAIFVLAAVALSGLCFWWIRRRLA